MPMLLERKGTLFHAIFDCEWVRLAWKSTDLLDVGQEAPRTSMRQCLAWIAEKIGEDKFIIVMAIAWAMWAARNEVVFHGGNPLRDVMTHRYLKMVHEAAEYITSLSETVSSAGWTTPLPGMVKVNTDAHVATGLTVRLDFVVRNEWGEILLMGVRRVPAKLGGEETKTATILYGLTRTLEANYDRIVLESDSLELISRLHYGKRCLAAVDLILEDIRAKIVSCSSLPAGHVKGGAILWCI
ncbi:hypothetical protein Cgig2_029850 [Carnegiea gigantea]|uniref:RNase H type-1 domain-containing protein n=1 Tax=Carnegiea gigantea TaxID=171969 RepID=A0A9Q1JMN1_9CARY|nr:hypothetical protein Cgig2_029850 [Carnegiea gigantea]